MLDIFKYRNHPAARPAHAIGSYSVSFERVDRLMAEAFGKKNVRTRPELLNSQTVKQKSYRFQWLPKALILAMGLLFLASFANAADRYSVATGNWNATSTWSATPGGAPGASVPVAADNVFIEGGFTVTITASSALCTNLSIAASSALTNGGFTMTVSGTTSISGTFTISSNLAAAETFVGLVTINSGGTWTSTAATAAARAVFRNGIVNNSANIFNAGGATFNTNAQSLGGTGSFSFIRINVATATTLTNNQPLTVSTILTGPGTLINSATGLLNIGGSSSVSTLNATAIGNSVNYTGVTQTVKPTTFYNLTLSGSGAKTTTSVTVNGILSMEGTTTASAVPTYGAGATLQYNTVTGRTAGVEWITPFAATGGVIIANTGTITANTNKEFSTGSPLTIENGATLSMSTLVLTLNGDLVNNGGTVSGTTGGINIAGTAIQSIGAFTTTGLVSMIKPGGTATLTGNVNGNDLTINDAGGTLHLGAGLTHTFTGIWTRSNGTLNGGSSIFRIGGNVNGTGGVFSAGTGTVDWNGAGAQNIAGLTYNNLTLSGTLAKTFPAGTTTVNGILSMEGTATATLTGTLTYGGAATLQYNTATARTAGAEWLATFPATGTSTGGVIVANTGAITLDAAKVVNAPVTINSGATLASGNFQLTFGDNFVNSGTFTAGSAPIVLANTSLAQSISGFTTTGLLSMTKTAGTATFQGNVNAAGLTINGTGGTLNLGTGLTHTFTDVVTLAAGALNGGSSTLNENAISTTAWNGNGSLFTAGTGTVNFGAAGAQTIAATTTTFNNLTLSTSGVKTFTNANSYTGALSILGTASIGGTPPTGPMTRLVVTLPGQTFTSGTGNTGTVTAQTAGSAFNIVSLTATDANFNVITSYSGAKTIAYSGPAGSPTYTTAVNFTSGVSTTTLATTLTNVQSTTITATDGGSFGNASSSLTVNAGALDHFAISAISSPQTAGTAITGVSLTAQDLNNNTVTSFTGTVDYSGTAGITGTSAAFTAGQLTGVSVTPAVAGSSLTFIVTGATKTGTSTFNVNAGAMTRLVVTLPGQTFTAGSGNSGTVTAQTAGSAFNIVSLTATDANFNVITSYNGAKTIAYAGPAGSPTYTTAVSFTSGVSTTTLTTTLTNVQSTTITATDGGSFGNASSSLTVNAGALDHFAISAIPSPQTAGTAITGVSLTAQDLNNNTVTSFTGTVDYSGTAGITGTSAAFTAGQLTGVSVTPGVAGSSLTFIVTGATKTGTSTFNVNAGAMTRLVVTLPGQTFTAGSGNSGTVTAQTAGSAFNIVSLTATDANFNVITSYNGAKTIAYSGPAGSPTYTTAVNFTSGVSTTTLATTLTSVQSTTITATDGGSFGNASSSLTVNAGAMTRLVVTLPGQTFTPGTGNSGTVMAQTAGSAFNVVSLTATDANFNVITSYTGAKTIAYAGPAGSPTYTTAVNFTNGVSTTTLATTLTSVQSTTITATDVGSFGNASSSLSVNPGALTRLVITLPGQTFTPGTGNSGTVTVQIAGSAFNIVSLTATDANFNVVTSYSGAKTIAYAGPAGSPTYTTAVSFTSGVSTTTLATTLTNVESTTITATDGGSLGTASSSLTVNATIAATAIAGVTVPVTGATPVTTVTAGTGYTGTVAWSGSPTTFANATIYTATITITPTAGYTLTGVTADQFTIAGSTSDTNPANSGVITAAFPATETPATANLSNIALSGSPTGYTFDPATYSYTGVSVLNGVASITITPTGAGTITVNGNAVASGQASAAISLTAGTPELITIVATETGKSAKTYTLSVTRSFNPAKAITALTILGNGTVNESAKTIAVTVPFGTDLTALVASFSTTGASVKVGTVTQTSGTTANNFSSPVTYRVTAADASTQDYIVTVSAASNTTKAMTAFTILGNGTVNESAKTIAVTVPFGTNLTALVASFSTTGASVKVGTVTQTSGTTANNFSSPVTYRVTATDASTQDYIVTVSVEANPAKAITAFTILGNGTVNESAKTIAVTVPFGTNLTALVASFSTTGASVKVGTVTQTSGTTANNFSSPVTYRVTAADASTQDYIVTVSVQANPAKAITAFTILGNGTVNESAKTIAVTVPFGTDLTALVPNFTTSGASVKVGTVTQTSGTTANNFTSPVTYKVTAGDASTQDYIVTVSVVSNTTKAMTAFAILGNGTLNEGAKTIAVTVPFGTDLTALVPNFSTTGSSVKVGTVTQISGTTANNFSSPVTYRVTAADASTQDYIVTVTIAGSTSKSITAFTILGNGTVDQNSKTITVTVPFGTDRTALKANFTASGTSVKVGIVVQTSGTTSNNFNSPVTYRVTAEDASTQDYIVTVNLGPDPQATPTFSPVAGAVVFGTEISMVSSGANAIHYTIDGTNPAATVGGSTLLYNPAAKPTINAAATIKAIALKTGIPNSAVGSAAYTQAEAPDISNISISGSPYNYAFAPSTYLYSGVSFVNSITSITITATGSGTIKIDGVAGTNTANVPLVAGTEKVITIVASAPGRSDKTYKIAVIRAKPDQVVPDPGGNTVTNTTPEVLVTSPTQEIIMTVSSGTVAPKLDYGTMITGGKGIVPKTTINSSLANVLIPAFTNIVSSDTSWNGVLLAPTPATATLPPTVQDEVKLVRLAIEVGAASATLSFDKAVRILMAGQTGTKVGFISPGSEFQEIITTGADNQTAADSLPSGGVYKVDNGTDMIVWTKHFTKFITYTPKSTVARINSTIYTIDSATIKNVPPGIEKGVFLAGLTKANINQVWDVTGIDAIVMNGNILISTAQDSTTKVVYTIFITDPALTLMPGSIGSNQVLCGSIAAPLAEILTATGGSGTYTYQWQRSVTSANAGFTNIPDATKKDYNPGSLNQSTWYRRLVNSPGFNSAPAISNVVSVTIVPALSNNVITPPLLSAYCQSGDPSVISGSNPNGGSGSYTYQWQSSANGILFTNITGATSKDYNPAVLTDTIYYQRIVTTGSCSSISNKIAIFVTQTLRDNTIAAPNLVEFCSNGDPEIITGTIPSNGNGNYLYQWQSSVISTTDGFTNIAGATSRNYDPGSISQTTYYRRQVTYGFCTFSTNVIRISIQAEVKNNVITAPSVLSFCQSGNPEVITASLPTGGNGTIQYQWQSSTSSPTNGFNDINGAVSKDYDPGVIKQTTYFRREITVGSCAYLSNAITFAVTQGVANNIITSDQTVISGNSPAPLNGSIPTGGDGKYVYLWESSVTSSSSGFSAAEGSNTGQNYAPGILTTTTFYRRRVTSGICQAGYGNGIQILVTPVNVPPVVLNDNYTISQNTALLIASPGVLQNDTDPDNNLLTASVASQPVHGTLILNADGSFTYTPAANYQGIDSFTYMACDNGSPQLCTTGTVNINILGKPVIGIAKTVSTPLRQLDGKNTNILTYKIVVKNYGTAALSNIQVIDDLSKTFPFPTEFAVEGIPVSSNNLLKINGSYKGNGNNNLLQGSDVLAPGASDTIKITLKVTPSNNMMGPFNNSATARGTGLLGLVSDDISVNGTNPDPDNNGNPDENSVTPVMLEKVTIKVPEGFSPNGDGVNDALKIENLDNEIISLHVYNTLGSLVYRNDNYQHDWTGICNQGALRGRDIPDGTYYYVISKRNNKENYVRFITIKR